jgi:sarcosine oxidase subunit beta
MGPVQGIEGSIIAAGHGGDGVALPPITDKLISELIVSGQPSMSIDELNIARFQGGS